jgi:hypothetical protein
MSKCECLVVEAMVVGKGIARIAKIAIYQSGAKTVEVGPDSGCRGKIKSSVISKASRFCDVPARENPPV